MSGCRWKNGLATVVAVVLVFLVSSMMAGEEPKCMKNGCNNDVALSSTYCCLHEGGRI
ncbi:MAG: hypothetical protein UHS49_02100 [Faecalimonas sp.]|nr:hypothetical protein [Faecalimonas sp.]